MKNQPNFKNLMVIILVLGQKAEKFKINLVTPCTTPPPFIWNCVLYKSELYSEQYTICIFTRLESLAWS